ncbi:rhodanese-like domain-containing protein [Elizabethkingia argentiflava]|uniref:Rhodanese-like domain-containing protein n=1 Tax=Elizabethkingia argenteiflava TaxID=2681556 RepID=A0A845PW64_9FLAO|nr:rhodanese-like domain-containing protein [Elizabethkingia argenteiflava]NAW50697.1 rhodanese-like domain-containing protein [Elizabethkingia argenteiflava]
MIEDLLKTGNYHLIDVREPLELEMNGAIEEAINIPLGEIEERRDEIEKLNGPIIFFCRSGNRSGKATDFFKTQGLNNVYNGGAYESVLALLPPSH